jgi:hypothetical protein
MFDLVGKLLKKRESQGTIQKRHVFIRPVHSGGGRKTKIQISD